jgi:WD40-like Beta Propeller Repeat
MSAPYGSWKSPITSDLIVAGSIRLGEIRLEGETVYWSEGRPTEGGRSVVVKRTPDGQITDLTPAPLNVRTRVHEYGGGAFNVLDGALYFSNFADQRLYCQAGEGAPEPITPEASIRYADAVWDKVRRRILCIREDHSGDGQEPVNQIVAVADDVKTLVSGNDFYASPRLSPDGSQLAWITWNHPNMPWDGTELWVAEVNTDGCLSEALKVAGGLTESIFQPEWSPDGVLYFISDRTNWWNLYRWQNGNIEALCPKAAEFGLPQWGLAMTTYGFESAQSLICTYTEDGIQHLARLHTQTLKLSEIETPYSSIGGLQVTSAFAHSQGRLPYST